MKAEDQYLKFVRWEDADGLLCGLLPGFVSLGRVCHGDDEEQTYRELCRLVREEIDELVKAGKELPPPATRPIREAAGV